MQLASQENEPVQTSFVTVACQCCGLLKVRIVGTRSRQFQIRHCSTYCATVVLSSASLPSTCSFCLLHTTRNASQQLSFLIEEAYDLHAEIVFGQKVIHKQCPQCMLTPMSNFATASFSIPFACLLALMQPGTPNLQLIACTFARLQAVSLTYGSPSAVARPS